MPIYTVGIARQIKSGSSWLMLFDPSFKTSFQRKREEEEEGH
jgi:hypothetical protein